MRVEVADVAEALSQLECHRYTRGFRIKNCRRFDLEGSFALRPAKIHADTAQQSFDDGLHL